jgi:hypothetical protein
MNRCIANWQKSGQGADNAADRIFGSISNRSQHALGSCHEFFNGRQMYLLYLWVLLGRHGLLGSALQKLNVSVSATNGSNGVPSVVHGDDNDSLTENSTSQTKSKQNDDIVSLGRSIEQHGQSLVNVVKIEADGKEKERAHQMKMELQSTLQQLGGEKRSLTIQYAAESQKKIIVVADVIKQQILEIEEDIKQNSEAIEALESTPKKHNRTPE